MHPGVHSVNSIKVKHYSQKAEGGFCLPLLFDSYLVAEAPAVGHLRLGDGAAQNALRQQHSAGDGSPDPAGPGQLGDNGEDQRGNGQTGALLDLCKALFAYSDSAKSYFAK